MNVKELITNKLAGLVPNDLLRNIDNTAQKYEQLASAETSGKTNNEAPDNHTSEARPKSEVVREALAYLEDHNIHLMVEWAFDGDKLPQDVEELLNNVIASCVPTQEQVEMQVCEIIDEQTGSCPTSAPSARDKPVDVAFAIGSNTCGSA